MIHASPETAAPAGLDASATGEHWSANAVRALLVAALFMPLVTADLDLSPIFTKAVVFQGLVVIAAALWLPLALADRRYRPDWRNPLVLAATGYAAVSVLILPASLDPARSFWSTGLRMTGAVFTLHLWAWFLVLGTMFRPGTASRLGWRGFLAVASVVGLVADAVALRQYLALGFARARGTLDNPIFLASYCVINFWLSLWLAARPGRKAVRVAFALLAAAHLTAALLTATRAAALALAVSAAVAVAASAWRRLEKGRARNLLLAAVAGLVLATGIFFVWQFAGGAHGRVAGLPPFLTRLTDTNFGEDRLALWQIAGRGFLERPLLGWGQENFQLVFDRLVDPTGDGWMFDTNWYDRVHNQFLETLVGQGLVGLAAYLAIWGAAAWTGFRILKRREPGAAALLALLAAAAVGLSFSFDTPAAAMLFWATLALIAGQGDRIQETGDRGESRLSPAILGLALLVALGVIWIADLRPIQALSRYDVAMQGALEGKNLGDDLSAALAMNQPYRPSLILEAADVARGRRDSQTGAPPAWEPYVAALAAEAGKLADGRPLDYRYQLTATLAHRLLGEYDSTAFDAAESYAKSALSVAPQRANAYEDLADIAASRGNYARAAEAYAEAMTHTTMGSQVGRFHFRLAEMSAWQGDATTALTNLRAALARGYPASRDHRLAIALAGTLERGKVASEFSAYAESLVEPFASRFAVLRARALLAAKAGDHAALQRILDRAEQIAPPLRETIERETQEFRQ